MIFLRVIRVLKIFFVSGILGIALTFPAFSADQDKSPKLDMDRITASPALSGSTPRSISFSPDGKRVGFLKASQDDHQVLDLWAYNLDTGETSVLVKSSDFLTGDEQLSQEERARRERMRISSKGIVSYAWSKDGQKLLFPIAGDLHEYRLKDQKTKQLTNSEDYEIDNRFSPLGNYVSFIQDHNIHIVDVKSSEIKQLTSSSSPTIKNGSAEYIAQEEMDRDTGYWWSPDEKYIAYIQFDEAPVEKGTRYEVMRNDFNILEERYPRTGTNNVTVKLAIMDLETGKSTWVDLGKEKDIYLARVNWLPDSSGIFFQRQNRSQKKLDLIYASASDGKTKKILTEKSKYWINLHHILKFIDGGKEFIWASERSGYRHLYHYKRNGKLIKQLTAGKWVVQSLKAIDEEKAEVYFTANADTPLEQHLYKISLSDRKNSNPEKLTTKPGWHSITMAKNSKSVTGFIDRYSDPVTPPQVGIYNAAGEFVTWIEENALTEGHPYHPYLADHIQPEFGHFEGPSGEDLYYRLYKPAGMVKGQKYPVIFAPYGGPIAQMVKRSWGRLFHQYLAQSGYVVFILDNRGSANRGVAYESAIYHHMGEAEIADQVAGAEFLKGLDYVDPERMGIYGHSYGGYMTLMALFKAGDVFKVGVSGAPVTDWLLYDTHYTERYLGHPDKDPESYEKSSVFPFVDGLKGRLLLVHGMADDNVLFNHSSMLLDELQKKSIQFDFMAYPGQTHRIGSDPARLRHYRELIKRYFDDHL